MLRVALRPKWLAFLVLVMALAAAFAWLGKWQLERAVVAPANPPGASETVVPLEELAQPGAFLATSSGAHRTTVTGVIDPASLTTLTGRLQNGASGYWLVARLEQPGGASVALALGWAATPAALEVAQQDARAQLSPASGPTTVVGRLMPSEAPAVPTNLATPLEQNTLAVAALVNTWPAVTGGVYLGYVIADHGLFGLETIPSSPPVDEPSVNWLNIFYALEWSVFALFAFYIWWRMVKDAKEREEETVN